MSGREILKNEKIKNFLQYFGIEFNPFEEPKKFIEALSQIDPRYKGGRNLIRFQLEQDCTHWSEEAIKLIKDAADALYLLNYETPLEGKFGLVIVLGGARQSNLDRFCYAAEAVKIGKAIIGELVIAGSTRRLDDKEKENVSNYAPGAQTEEDLCLAAASLVSKENPGLYIEVIIVDNPKAGNLEVIEQAILQWKSESCSLNPRIAVVTTQIYQTAALLDLYRVAKKYGITDIAAAGNPSDSAIVAKRTTATYLSEVLRTLRAAVLAATE